MCKVLTDLLPTKCNPHKIRKNWPSAKLSPRKISKICRQRNYIHAKINPLKVKIMVLEIQIFEPGRAQIN